MRVQRRPLLVFTVIAIVAALGSPATAASSGSSRVGRSAAADQGALADRDRNGISDELAALLDARSARARLDVIVLHDGSVTPRTARGVVGPFRSYERFTLVDGFAARLTVGQVRAVAAIGGVTRVQTDAAASTMDSSSDPDYGAAAARNSFGVDGTGAGICVLDTGADPNHEQLAGKISAFRDFIGSGTVSYDDHGHGTHVAAIAAGDGTGGANAAANVGVAPGASLFVGKVLAGNGSGTTTQIVNGIEWCAARAGVDVITMSLGTSGGSDGRDALSLAADAAVDAGKVVTVAAGNSGDLPMSVGSPGAAAKAITIGAGSDWSAPVGSPNHDDGIALAYFSSRGPTLDGRTKPDVVGPGVTVTSAKVGTSAGYVTYSGTSMATPYAAGAAALAIGAGMAPSAVKTAIMQTAQDRGIAGVDPDWGAGLLDAQALVARAMGTTAATAFPAHTSVRGSVGAGGTWTYAFDVDSGDLAVPIAATIVIDGECLFLPGFGCLGMEWSPDLDARLRAPNGTVLDESICALGSGCGLGRQETLHAMPTVAGTYRIEVYPYGTTGGAFSFDLSSGIGGSAPPPSPPPAPGPTSIHVGDLDGTGDPTASGKWRAKVTVTVHDDLEATVEGVTVAVRFGNKGSVTCTTNTNGRCTVGKTYAARKASITASVLSLTGALPYVSSANHDGDGDSDGTSITVRRP